MTILKITFCAAYTAFVAFSGMYWQVVQSNTHFEDNIGVPISSIYEAKARCEKIAGPGNCRIVGGFIPEPSNVIVVPPSAQKPKGSNI